MTEDQLEQEALGWLAELGWQHHPGQAIAPDSATPQRSDYRQVLLRKRLAAAIARLISGQLRLPEARAQAETALA